MSAPPNAWDRPLAFVGKLNRKLNCLTSSQNLDSNLEKPALQMAVYPDQMVPSEFSLFLLLTLISACLSSWVHSVLKAVSIWTIESSVCLLHILIMLIIQHCFTGY
jgi:hypothetical protein